jgi:glycyl-tRNA synthetase
LYLGSLAALGIDLKKHDVRFVEDNWESPALGAWGLGWEVWLDGLEITQFTYFQQAGGFTLDPVSVEITYGLERIIMALQGVDHFKKIRFTDDIAYGEVFAQNEYEMSVYNLDEADVERVAQLFNLYEAEAQMLLDKGLPLPAYGYILKTSNTFNILDARGAVGVTERARYFARMRNLAQAVARLWMAKREEQGFPLGGVQTPTQSRPTHPEWRVDRPQTFVLEIGSEELPAGDVTAAVEQLRQAAPALFEKLRLAYAAIDVQGTPRRLSVMAQDVAAKQPDETLTVRGPLASIAFDADGNATKAGRGFAKSRGVDVSQLQRQELDGKEYVTAQVNNLGRPAGDVLAEALPELIASLTFGKSMRWNWTNTAYSRPLRWCVALLGDQVIPFTYAGLASGRASRGLRNADTLEFEIPSAAAYAAALEQHGIWLNIAQRRDVIWEQAQKLAVEAGGRVPESAKEGLLDEVTNLVEHPTLLLGRFEDEYLSLPRDVLVTVMRKHQRYFPVEDAQGSLLPYFITAANGQIDAEAVRAGNEAVIRARYADAAFFWKQDTAQAFADFRPALSGLIFQGKLGSMLDKTARLEHLVAVLADTLHIRADERQTLARAAALAKADLVTHMGVEFTSLAGIMGREYALRSGESAAVAQAIFEHTLPRYAGDRLPVSLPGMVLALADRLDSLAGLFGIGLVPKATSDPFALRRAALGIVQTLIERDLKIDLRDAIHAAAQLQPVQVSAEAEAQVLDFIVKRMQQWLLERGERHDLLQAVLNTRGFNPASAVATLQELNLRIDSDEFQQVLTAYSRPARIIRDREIAGDIDPDRFETDAERAVWQHYQHARQTLTPASSLSAFVDVFAPLVPHIDRFFDQVMVMADDETLRNNRLRLMKAYADLTAGIVDLMQIQGS